MIVTHGNVLENSQLCTHFTDHFERTYSNTSGNVLKVVTVGRKLT